jgi:hypothetical protein
MRLFRRKGARLTEFLRNRVLIFFVFIFLVELGLFDRNPVLRGTRSFPQETLFNGALTSADSGLQLESGDRVKRCLSEGSAPSGFFSSAEDALKRRMT